MFYQKIRCIFFLMTLSFVSGCAFFSQDNEIEEYGLEIVAESEPLTVTSLSVADRPSPNFDARTLPVSLIVLHYTAAPLKESLAVLRKGRGTARVSSHYLISENGTIYRLVDESKRAWHAGISHWKDITDVNSASIGIELVNLGKNKEGHFYPFAEKQIEAVTKLCLDIQSRYAITDVVGHSDVAPVRKIDPGDLFPWQKLYNRGVKVNTKGFTPPSP